jgi:HK97 family phage prohead protease
MSNAPTDNLLRAWIDPAAIGLEGRSTDDVATDVMVGHFAVFGRWTEIASWYEGNFMERLAPTAFDDTLASGRAVKVLYDHGADPMIGNKPLGTPDLVEPDKKGVRFEVGLFDATYVNDLKPALRAGQLGASFRFKVLDDSWSLPAKASAANPKALEERTITKVELYEFGPVTFPAYAEATAGMRSGTDAFLEHLMGDPKFLARFAERTSLRAAQNLLTSVPDHVRTGEDEAPDEPTHGRPEGIPKEQRERWLRSRRIA